MEDDSLRAESPYRWLFSSSESQSSPESPGNSQVYVNVAETQYPLVRQIAQQTFNWSLSYYRNDPDCDIYWTDGSIPPSKLAQMQAYQKVNHFPGMYMLARKNHLARNLGKMKKVLPEEYDFFPNTWVLPKELAELKAFAQKNPKVTFILKPDSSCQGRGISLTQLGETIGAMDNYIAQRYIDRPFLINNLKFDLRLYVLLAGCSPLRIYLHQEGLVRFATEPYTPPTPSNLASPFMHLTNYAVNKLHPAYIPSQSPDSSDSTSHKRSLHSLYTLLQSQGYDVNTLKREIEAVIVKTVVAVQPVLGHIYRTCKPEDVRNGCCFEVLGFDVLLDQELKPWLLEVNHSPSFAVDTPLDERVKRRVIEDAFQLLHITSSLRQSYYHRKQCDLAHKTFHRSSHSSFALRTDQSLSIHRERDLWEEKHCGGYQRLRVNCEKKYEMCLNTAVKLWEKWTGMEKCRKKRENTPKPVIKNTKVIKIPFKKSVSVEKISKNVSSKPEKVAKSIDLKEKKRENPIKLPLIPSETHSTESKPLLPRFHRHTNSLPKASGSFLPVKLVDLSLKSAYARRQGSDFGFFEGRRP